ncbi:FUSC family protein [Streptomyces sp. NPDC059917]|uniref:FUSC family protein n=1 Tax=Streptomyces sp. NPDC059917 TaxID=3347002 RepID=UPI0036578E25
MTSAPDPLRPATGTAATATPSPWWRQVLAVRRVPVDRALVVRGALGILVPLAAGQLAGEPALGAAAALGAYGAAVDDSSAPWRVRAQMLLLPQFGGAAGLALGHATAGSPVAQVALLLVTALISGLLSTTGRVANTATLVLLLATAMGIGLPPGGPWWRTPLLFVLGGLPLILWSVAVGMKRSAHDERASVAAAFRAVAALLDLPAGATASARSAARRAVTASMDTAHETLLGRRPTRPRPGSPTLRLGAALDALIEVIAAVPGAHRGPRPVPVDYGLRLADIAAYLERDARPGLAPPTAVHPLPAVPVDPELRALHEAVVHAGAPVPADYGPPSRLPAWTPPGSRLLRTLGERFADRDAWAFALRLTACMTVAQAIASFTDLPRSGWIVLTVALLVRPGLGTVPARLITRLIGTFAGVLLGLLLIAVLPTGWPRIAALVVLTGLLQAYARRTYLFQTFFLTPVMLLLADPLGLAGADVPRARLLDTLIGAAVALVVGYLLWPENDAARLTRHLARAHDRIADYIDALADENADRYVLHAARRTAHHDLAALHAELDRLRTDPRHRAALPAWREHLGHAERVLAELSFTPSAGLTRGRANDLATEQRHRARRIRS